MWLHTCLVGDGGNFYGVCHGLDQAASLIQYYKVIYNNRSIYLYPIPIVSPELLEKIKSNQYYDNSILNIVIKYFNDIIIDEDDLNMLEYLDYSDNLTLFYYIPAVIYILEQYVENMLK